MSGEPVYFICLDCQPCHGEDKRIRNSAGVPAFGTEFGAEVSPVRYCSIPVGTGNVVAEFVNECPPSRSLSAVRSKILAFNFSQKPTLIGAELPKLQTPRTTDDVRVCFEARNPVRSMLSRLLPLALQLLLVLCPLALRLRNVFGHIRIHQFLQRGRQRLVVPHTRSQIIQPLAGVVGFPIDAERK